MKSVIIAALIMAGLVYFFPSKTVTIQFADGTTSTAIATPFDGEVTVGCSYPIYKSRNVGYVVGTKYRSQTQQAEIIAIRNDW
ncbi:MAG: hypothetical protein V4665_03580 [Patescibacteria group bacterium]